jgi:hypothetical protein
MHFLSAFLKKFEISQIGEISACYFVEMEYVRDISVRIAC